MERKFGILNQEQGPPPLPVSFFIIHHHFLLIAMHDSPCFARTISKGHVLACRENASQARHNLQKARKVLKRQSLAYLAFPCP